MSSQISNDGSRRRRGSLPKAAVESFKTWLNEHQEYPYPSDMERQEMARRTGLALIQVSYWFINARRRILPVILKLNGKNPDDYTISRKRKREDIGTSIKYLDTAKRMRIHAEYPISASPDAQTEDASPGRSSGYGSDPDYTGRDTEHWKQGTPYSSLPPPSIDAVEMRRKMFNTLVDVASTRHCEEKMMEALRYLCIDIKGAFCQS